MNSIEFNIKLHQINDPLMGFAMRLTRNKEDAKDLVQETALLAFANKKKFRPNTNFKAWVCTIMRNSYINKYRKMRMRKEVEYSLENVSYDIADTAIEEKNTPLISIKELLSIVDQLSDTSRVPFLMHYNGYEYQEIAEFLEVPIGTVKSRIHFARTKLKESIRQYYNTIL